MKGLLVFVFAFALLGVTLSQNVEIVTEPQIPVGSPLRLNSAGEGYPGAALDKLWRFQHDVEVTVRKLNIDGQRGDFLLLSKQPFPVTRSPLPIADVINQWPIDESILLSWTANDTLVFRLLHEEGVAIFFHGLQESSIADLEFQLEISYFERKPEEVTTTTEPPTTIPPGQTPNDYVTKFVTGKTPTQFVSEVDVFRDALANMTNKYCQSKGIELQNAAKLSDVMVPQEEMRFCSRSWPTFKECVEVTFAIAIYDVNGAYVMTGVRIDEMWSMYSGDLIPVGYFPYIPPKEAVRTAGWIWVVACLGSVIVVSVLLCLAWLKKASDDLNRDKEVSKAMTQVTDEEKFYERENPLHQIRKTMVNGKLGKREDHDSGQGSWDRGQGVPGGYYVPSLDGSESSDIFRVNKIYVPEDDEEEEYFRRPDSRVPTNPEWPQQNLRPPYFPQKNFAFEDDE